MGRTALRELAEERPVEFIDPVLTLRRKSAGVRVHRMHLAPPEVVTRQGFRATSPLRTVTDLLRAGPRDHAW